MIEYIISKNNKLQKVSKVTKNCWINLNKPTLDDINKISKLLNIKKNDFTEFKENIESLKDLEEIPFLEKQDDKYFIITRIPQKKENGKIVYSTTPLGIFINKNYVITINYANNDIINTFIQKNIKFDNNFAFIYRLLLLSSRKYLTYLKEIDKKIKSIEENINKMHKNEQIIFLLALEKSLVFFSTSLKGNEILFNRFYKLNYFTKNEDNKDILEDVIDENKQAIQMTVIYASIIKNTLNVYSSIISNNINQIMKVLTSITIIIAIPTLVASIYGMNVELPFQHSVHAFNITMLISLLFTLIVSIIIWKKKWL